MQERTTRGGAGEVAWGRLASKFWRQPAQKSAWSLIISQKPLKEQGTNKSTRFGAYSHLHASAGVHPAVFALHPSSAPFPQMCLVLFWWEAAPVLGTAHRMCASTSARLQRWVQMKKQWCASYQRHWSVQRKTELQHQPSLEWRVIPERLVMLCKEKMLKKW